MIYELFLLTSNNEKTSKEIYEKFKKKFTKVLKDEVWGLKKLAYKIDSLSKGHYYLLIGETDKKIQEELKYELKINKDFIRYMLLNLENEVKNIDNYINGKLITKWVYIRQPRTFERRNSKYTNNKIIEKGKQMKKTNNIEKETNIEKKEVNNVK